MQNPHQQIAQQSNDLLDKTLKLKQQLADENAALDQELAELNGQPANEAAIEPTTESSESTQDALESTPAPAAEPTISLPKYEPDANNDQPGTHNLNDPMLPSTADYVPPMQQTNEPANHWSTPAVSADASIDPFKINNIAPSAPLDQTNTDQANSNPSDRY